MFSSITEKEQEESLKKELLVTQTHLIEYFIMIHLVNLKWNCKIGNLIGRLGRLLCKI